MKSNHYIRFKKAFVVAALVVTFGACGKGGPTSVAEHGPDIAQPMPSANWAGTVLETMDADRYTYVRVDLGEEEIWAAAPHFEVAVGDRIEMPQGVPMQDFHSQTLDRTFDVIYFVESIGAEGAGLAAARMPPSHPVLDHPQAEAVTAEVSGIEKAVGGFTVAEIHERKAELAGRAVTLRGEVVKVNQGILGSNWLHVQDGSGSEDDGTNDLTVTTSGLAAVGQSVLITGTLELDRDFGAGYRYPVIVTGAQVTVE